MTESMESSETVPMTDEQVNDFLKGYKSAPVPNMNLAERFQLEQIRLLKSIKGMLNFFVVLTVIGILLYMLASCNAIMRGL